MKFKIFKYLESLDCFIVDPEYKKISDYLGLTEWNEVVWIGRYFVMDNDVGEHWFDNWNLREKINEKAKAMGLEETELFIINPDRFQNGIDGPCHTAEERGLFWKDVLICLELSLPTLIREARKLNEQRRESEPEAYIADLESRISELFKRNV